MEDTYLNYEIFTGLKILDFILLHPDVHCSRCMCIDGREIRSEMETNQLVLWPKVSLGVRL